MKPALKLIDKPSNEPTPAGSSPQIVRLHGWTDQGPLVAGESPQVPPRLARWSSSVSKDALVNACEVRQEALVVRTHDGDPVILALLAPPIGADTAPVVAPDVLVDGRRVELVANEELTLRCGDACISLMKDGRVVVRGVQVETRAKGANRIRGGTVEIN